MMRMRHHRPGVDRPPATVPILLTALFALQGHGATVATPAAVRADGTLLVGDRAVFPIAIRTEKAQADDFERIAAAGFNMVMGSGEWGPDHYAQAHRHGLLILAGHYVWATFATFRGSNPIDLTPEGAAGLRTVLKSARDQGRRGIQEALGSFDHLPGVIGWNTNEEPEAKMVQVLEYAYEIWKSNTPAHLVVSLSCDPRWFHVFRNTADVLIYDHYPFRGTGRGKRSLLKSCENIRYAREVLPGKSVWLMSQLLLPSRWSRDPADEISVTDMRLQHYAGLIGGARGIVMYHYDVLRKVPEGDESGQTGDDFFARRWDVVATVAAELRELAPVLRDGRPTRDLRLTWLEPGDQGPGPQLTREIDHFGTKYLLVANPTNTAVEAGVAVNNDGNRAGYTASVHQGGGLSVRHVEKNDGLGPGPRVDRIVVGPRGAGAFVLARRPIPLDAP